MSPRFRLALFLVFAAAAVPLFAQLPVQTQKAELAIPFGVVPGRLVTVGEYLVFIDEEKPEASFALTRAGMRNLSYAAEVVTVETLKPVRDRSGEKTVFSFRLASPQEAPPFAEWFKTTAGTVTAASPQTGKEAEKKEAARPEIPEGAKTYQARHTHFPRGGCSGRLIIEPNRVVFESVGEIDHSRQWDLRDIKELRRDSPYSIRIVPFAGNEYNLQLQGQGMDSNEFKALVDRITAARIK